jgi:DNA (cytosine-5)-methyltransferase 1
LKVIDLFTGCGGLSQGFKNAGYKCNGFVEFWNPAIKTHKLNFLGVELIGEDITQITKEQINSYEADVIVGGPPCQGFSMAGRRNKLDERNTLFQDYLKFVEELQPKLCVMENVKGIYSMKADDGEFIFNKIINSFKSLGYFVKAKVLNSGNYGVPQKRQRVIFIAAKKENQIKFPEHIKEKTVLNDVLTLPYEEIPELNHVYSYNKKLFKKAHYLKQGKRYSSFHAAGIKLNDYDLSPTITKSGRYIHPRFNRFISVREAARIQSFSDEFLFEGKVNEMYSQIGNAVPVKMAEAIARTLKEVS